MRLLNGNQIRELDRVAIEDWGVPGILLMENAGVAATRLLLERWKPDKEQQIAIFAGSGNNGGDGYVIARHLINQGYTVQTFLCSEPQKLSGDAAINYQILTKMGDVIPCHSWEDFVPWKECVSSSSVIVDALLGTGLQRPVSGWFLELIDWLNGLEKPVKVAVDIPSGLDSLSGIPKPRCFRADHTVTFAFAKVGLCMPDALPFVGQLDIVDIGIPAPIRKQTDFECRVVTESFLRQQWPIHSENSHKGTYGHLLVIGGAQGKIGAVKMTSRAALRSGVGLCTVAVEEDVFLGLSQSVLEVMCASFRFDAFEERLESLQEGKSAIAFGPGFGVSHERGELLASLLLKARCPLVIDADGLNLLSSRLELLKQANVPIVLTPHPGEMGRLLDVSTREVQQNRLAVARQFAQEFGVYLVLKGSRTLVALPTGEVWLNVTGNAGLATAGSGDVLTGMIGAFLARGFSPAFAAQAAVFLHGLAGDKLLQTHGKSGIIASSILTILPLLFADWETT